MNIKKTKSDKGISIIDIIIAMMILCIFVGVVGSLFYQIGLNSNLIKMNAVAVHYAVKLAEDIDVMPYEKIDNSLNASLNTDYEVPEGFNMSIEVEKYNKDDPEKADIIKIVTININYSCYDQDRSYKIQKLKIREY